MSLIKKYKKNKSLINCIILLSIFSVVNTVEGYIYGKFGLTTNVYILELLSFLIAVFLLNKMICIHEDGKCTTIKK
jgi:hypothetical protein